ncbi:MAG: chromosomal replication initiator protein DnaA [Sutterellaceae bacterium]|nr:chromosomal replication initiator protein DnaA [Sutterellaceae bacterium]
MSEFWSQCIDELKRGCPAEVFQNWFADLTAEFEPEAGSVTVFAPSMSKLRTIRTSYGKLIEQIINRVAGQEIDLFWGVQPTSATPSIAPAPADPEKIQQSQAIKTGLLPNLTFENMVEGQANQMAFASALQVATSPNPIYNPLFIYGGVGLGKTHLMHAIGNRFLKNNPKAKVLCVSAQQYIQEFVDAMRLKSQNSDRYSEAMRQFEARYNGLDLLLIDDIQSFGSRDGTQTNFFLTFESMVPHGKQIVLTSDTYPRQLKEFQERLLSRLTQGLIVTVEPPEFDMRVQILLQKAERSNLEMPHDVAEIIAKKLKSNVRELEGAVQQILAYTRFHQVDVTIDTVKLALRDIFKQSSVPVTVDAVQQAVADYYGIKASDINAKSRKANLARARQIAMYLAKELTNKSLPELGSLFGGRDHTTVIYACKKIASERNTDEALKHDLHILAQRIKN